MQRFLKNQWVVSDRQNEWVLQEQKITNISHIQRQLPSFTEENHDIHKCLCMGEPQLINQLESTLKDKSPNLTIYKLSNNRFSFSLFTIIKIPLFYYFCYF